MGVSARRPASAYRPRLPRDSPLWRLLERHYDEFERVYDDRYQKRYGFWRPVIGRTVRKFLACGDLQEGFARVRCPRCRHERFVPFSCRRRCLCPSCHQKRALVIADHIARDVCAAVPHRQFVFTVPKRLRVFFRFDRRLLGALARLAWQSVLEVHRAVLERPDARPGMVATIHTFGELIHFHPHIHALLTDGVFGPDGTFCPMPAVDARPYETLWQHKVFDLLLRENKITEALVDQMKGWRHSGFSVHNAVRLEAGDSQGIQRLCRYMLRCPFSLARVIRLTERDQVIYRAHKHEPRRFPRPASPDLFGAVSRNFQLFEALDFIAEVTQHVPDHGRHLIRYYGFYSNKTRGLRARDASPSPRDGVRTDDRHTPGTRRARQRWSALIRRVWEVDPLTCPRCGTPMRVCSLIQPSQRDVIDRILAHCGLRPPVASRAPPAAPDDRPRERRYVRDLEGLDVNAGGLPDPQAP